MIVGIGIDLVELGRFGKRLSPELIDEIFLPEDTSYSQTQQRCTESFAARFAAKEAAFKALGAGLEQGLRFRQVEVLKEESGAVRLSFNGAAAELAASRNVTHSFVSLSHSRDSAIAMVVLENRTL